MSPPSDYAPPSRLVALMGSHVYVFLAEAHNPCELQDSCAARSALACDAAKIKDSEIRRMLRNIIVHRLIQMKTQSLRACFACHQYDAFYKPPSLDTPIAMFRRNWHDTSVPELAPLDVFQDDSGYPPQRYSHPSLLHGAEQGVCLLLHQPDLQASSSQG